MISSDDKIAEIQDCCPSRITETEAEIIGLFEMPFSQKVEMAIRLTHEFTGQGVKIGNKVSSHRGAAAAFKRLARILDYRADWLDGKVKGGPAGAGPGCVPPNPHCKGTR